MTDAAGDLSDALDIAVVGMSGRFPGAATLDAFWDNLRRGVESISSLDDRDLDALGVPRSVYTNPNFVKASPVLADADRFDAEFFGYSPGEAEIMDPQHRVFLECAWEALEAAGYPPDKCPGLVGVFAGTSLSSYLLYHLLPRLSGPHADEAFQVMIGNDKDFLSTRVSYKLNLHGPSLTVQTGCSTSLVATHLACQALLSYQCDIALAGGVSIQVPSRAGYMYQEGGLQSPDGHCRAFDANAQGTLFGSGAGVVVLKRIADALADRNAIHAVIKGTAINNDGNRKVGFTAPSVLGQTGAIQAALALARVDPGTIGYVECHGTGTALGDPIEIAALGQAFAGVTAAGHCCALGSVKTNVGHLDAAAGVAGLIKTILALKHGVVPPSLNFESPNPAIAFEGTPFSVNTEARPWEPNGERRRAGVSSFGIGGTNAHVVLEEAPPLAGTKAARAWHVFLLSAKNHAALERHTDNLRSYVDAHPEIDLADAAYTTHVGRSVFDYRRAVIAHDREDLRYTLETRDARRLFTRTQKHVGRSLVFMFPGGGAQYVNMGADLYRTEPVFRASVDRCADLLQRHHRCNVKADLFAAARADEAASALMRQSSIGLPALFIVEYALAQVLMSVGITPDAMIGHSLGEYTAACIAGVFSLESALALIIMRSRLMQQLPSGAMLSVPMSLDELQPWLTDGVAIAAANGPTQSVVSGPADRISALMQDLDRHEIEYRRLAIDVAAHSEVVTPILAPFSDFLETVTFHHPTIPFISNVSGTWITPEEAVDPAYWVAHLRNTVRFGDGVLELLKTANPVFVEAGPGHTLTTICRSLIPPGVDSVVVSSMRHSYDQQPDDAVLAAMMAKLWLADIIPDWQAFHSTEQRYRQPLPTYPFERKRYWVSAAPNAHRHAAPHPEAEKIGEVERWFYVPVWKNPPAPPAAVPPDEYANAPWLVFADRAGLASSLIHAWSGAVSDLVVVGDGKTFGRVRHDAYEIDPDERDHYSRLVRELRDAGKMPRNIVHVWNVTANGAAPLAVDAGMSRVGFYSLLFLVQALVEADPCEPVDIWVLGTHAFRVESGDVAVPEQSLAPGLCKVVPQEFPHIRCHFIDLGSLDAQSAAGETLGRAVAREILERTTATAVAYRGNRRWMQAVEPYSLEHREADAAFLREEGVYLLTGGTGSLGLLLADYLARTVRAKLVLTTRTPFPPRDEWTAWLDREGGTNPIGQTIRALQSIEAHGSEVLVLPADAADASAMTAVVDTAVRRFGAVHGVMHLAGVTGAAALRLIPDIQPSTSEPQFRAKLDGTRVLTRVLAACEPDFVCLFSSNAAVLGGPGLATYTAANTAMCAYAQNHPRLGRTRWISVDWDAWQTATARLARPIPSSLDACAMTPDEGLRAFARLMASRLDGEVIVSTADLAERLRQWIEPSDPQREESGESAPSPESHDRPALDIAYVPPRDDIEEQIARIWQDLLRIGRIGADDNFFDLGGTSLIALKIVSRVKKELGAEIPLVTIFEAPTVSALARAIADPAALDRHDDSERRGAVRRERQLVNARTLVSSPPCLPS